jgi:hypothetical protein
MTPAMILLCPKKMHELLRKSRTEDAQTFILILILILSRILIFLQNTLNPISFSWTLGTLRLLFRR